MRWKSDITRVASVLALLGLGAVHPCFASEVVYRPINPSFGGNPLNSSHLLGLADRQNQYNGSSTSGGSSSPISSLSQGEQFVNQLSSLLFSALAQDVTQAIFGEDPELTGTVVFGSQTINWNNLGTSTVLTISDSATGSTTEIVVPNLN